MELLRRVRPATRLFCGLTAALALCLFGSAPLAGATAPPRPGVIAYDDSAQSGGASTEESCKGETSVETIGAEGGPSTPLASGTDPSYSPDGSEIVFSVCDGIQSDLMLMDADGGDLHALTSTPKISETDPTFSADGRRIVFARDAGGEGYSQIYSVGLDGKGLRRLTRPHPGTADERPAAAPDGRYLVFDRDGVLYTMRPDGARPAKLTRGWDAAVSPRGDRIVYSFRRQLWSIGPAGGHRRRLTHVRDPDYHWVAALSPSFSPDGRWIVFALEQSDSLAPGSHDSEKLDELSLATGEVVTLTRTGVGGFDPDWRPSP